MLINFQNFIKENHNLELKSVPLRIWTSDWPIPKKIELKTYSVNTTTAHKTNSNINRYSLWGEVESVKEFENRIYKNKKPSKWGKGKKSGRRFDYKRVKDNIWIKILSKSQYIDITNRKLSFDGKYLRVSLNKNEVAIWYLSGEGQIRFIILPKKIEIGNNFLEMIGLLDGEMCKKKNKTGGSALKISNATPSIICHILNQFETYFRIPKESWTASLTINAKEIQNSEEKNLRDYWSKITKINLKRFTKTTIQKKYRSKFSDNGIIQIRFSNTLFFLLLLEIMKKIRGKILLNKKHCEAYLRGLAAAEGGIIKRKNKLRMVQFGGVNKKDKDFYTKCLYKIGINTVKEYPNRVETYSLINFILLKKINIFKLHPRRNKHFLNSLTNLQKNYNKRITQS